MPRENEVAKTEHDQRVAGPGDKSVVKGHPALSDKEHPPQTPNTTGDSGKSSAKPDQQPPGAGS
jgi:hypothetical protein